MYCNITRQIIQNTFVYCNVCFETHLQLCFDSYYLLDLPADLSTHIDFKTHLEHERVKNVIKSPNKQECPV